MEYGTSKLLRVFLTALTVFILIQNAPAAAQSYQWNRTAYRLSPPGTSVRYEPYVVSDRFGRTYVFWSENSARPCCSNGQFSLLRAARFDGSSWSEPIDIQKVINGTVEHASIHIDAADMVHAVWVQREGPPNLYYGTVAVENILQPDLWQAPRRLEITQPGTDNLRLRVDGAGTMHLLFNKAQGIFYTRSTDKGVQWSTPIQLDGTKPQGYSPGIFQLELDVQNGLHAVWHQLDDKFVGRQIQYLRSTDGGMTWSTPFTIDQFDPAIDNPLTQSVGSPHGFVVSGDMIHIVWVGGPPGGPTGVGRKHRISTDRGLTWGETTSSILNGLWGAQNGDGLAADAGGRLHWVGLARNYVSQGKLWEGLWGGIWSGGTWSNVEPVVTVLSPGIDSPRLASTPDGQVVAAFRNVPAPDVLFATHTTNPYFYFPHYADGDGWSMQIAISNLSPSRAVGKLSVYDKKGQTQELPLNGGAASQIDLDMAPYSTKVFRSLGSSNPIKTGFIHVELDQPEISGIAIFQNTNGSEASVLPARLGRRYALLVERSASLQTGIAFVRHTPAQPVTLKLYDLAGNLVESKEYTGDPHAARFVEEFFPDTAPLGFRGLMVVESEALISAVGLRLGAGILSTIPVTDLDAIAGSGTYYFPHFGDGDGLSMLMAVSNLSQNPASGVLTILDPGGRSQELPLDSGPTSQVPLNLQPNATGIFQTSGSSSPAKSGFIRVDADRPEVSGVAIFKYTDGREASVLPSYKGKKFALFVEQSASFYTGIAIAREGTEPVTLSLYDENGTLVGTQEYSFDPGGSQRARFLGQIFSLPETFRGLLIMQSEGEFATIGLRFGGSVLATIPVTPMN